MERFGKRCLGSAIHIEMVSLSPSLQAWLKEAKLNSKKLLTIGIGDLRHGRKEEEDDEQAYETGDTEIHPLNVPETLLVGDVIEEDSRSEQGSDYSVVSVILQKQQRQPGQPYQKTQHPELPEQGSIESRNTWGDRR